jgi:hypothetical protein
MRVHLDLLVYTAVPPALDSPRQLTGAQASSSVENSLNTCEHGWTDQQRARDLARVPLRGHHAGEGEGRP